MRTAPLVAALVLAVTGASCVTRTVYVVDDDRRNDVSSPAPASAATPDAMPYEQSAGIASPADFYEPLSPYGSWVAYPGYGRVFVPNRAIVGAGFRPYTDGHWEYSEWGWTWVSHAPFGWATGHYGRWFYDSSYGWVWVPGTVWAPAWVSWRTGGGYVGWAPLPPGADFGGAYSVYETSWVFVSYSALGAAYIGSAIIVGDGYHHCYVSTYPSRDVVYVHGRRYYRGPDEHEVVSHGGHVIHRPARDADRDHPVTRPPSGTARPRPGHDGGANDGGRHDSGAPDGTSRPRPGDGQPSDGRGGYDGGSSGRPSDGSSSGRPSDGRPSDGRPSDGRPSDGRPSDGSAGGRGDVGSYGDSGRTPPRDLRGGRPSGLDDLDPNAPGRAVDITPREDPADGVVNSHGVPHTRGDTGRGVVDDNARPITPRGDYGNGRFQGSRDDAQPAPVPYTPGRDVGGTAGGDAGPYGHGEVVRPRDDQPIDPDLVHGIHPGVPDRSPVTPGPDRNPYGPSPYPSPYRAPGADRGPATAPYGSPGRQPDFGRQPSPGGSPYAPSPYGGATRAPAYGGATRAPSYGGAARAPSYGPAVGVPGQPAPSDGKSDGKSKSKSKGKSKGKSSSKAAPAPAHPRGHHR